MTRLRGGWPSASMSGALRNHEQPPRQTDNLSPAVFVDRRFAVTRGFPGSGTFSPGFLFQAPANTALSPSSVLIFRDRSGRFVALVRTRLRTSLSFVFNSLLGSYGCGIFSAFQVPREDAAAALRGPGPAGKTPLAVEVRIRFSDGINIFWLESNTGRREWNSNFMRSG